jgi:hypothetical protein
MLAAFKSFAPAGSFLKRASIAQCAALPTCTYRIGRSRCADAAELRDEDRRPDARHRPRQLMGLMRKQPDGSWLWTTDMIASELPLQET